MRLCCRSPRKWTLFKDPSRDTELGRAGTPITYYLSNDYKLMKTIKNQKLSDLSLSNIKYIYHFSKLLNYYD